MDSDSKKKLEGFYTAIRSGEKLSAADFRNLYELAGISIREEHGTFGNHNPCSVEVISEIVLRMAGEIKPCSLLDVGMGGYPFVDMELQKRGFKVTGLEYSSSLMGIAREILGQTSSEVSLVLGDGQNLPFSSASFEACLCSETLEHLPDDRKTLLEIHRILKPEGTLLLTVPNLWAFLSFPEKAASYFKNGSWVTHHTHLREYTYYSIAKIFRGLFKIEKWYPVPFTCVPFSRMPFENSLGSLVKLPFLKWGSLSYAFILRKS